MTTRRRSLKLLAGGLAVAGLLAACGSDDEAASTTAAAAETTAAAVETTAAAVETTAASGGDTTMPAGGGEGIVLAANPWTGSAVNAYVAKVVLEANGTPVEVIDIDENSTWVGLDDGSIDAVLEVWPSGHAADYETYITGKQSVVDLGLLGPEAKIGWYVPTFVIDENPALATWEGFQDPELAKLFSTAESGADLGQFLMGDPSYVTFDEQIIANLGLPLKYVVAGSEAALITAIQKSIDEKTPLLLQFWQPHWLQSKVALTEVKLPEVTDACTESAAAADGMYACDYPVDKLYKAASAGLEAKNAAAFAMLSKFQLTTEQQNEIAAMVDSDGMTPLDAATAWVEANADVVAGWMS
jgi:glycine betaine/proline transport system substrate-binding protein